MRPRRRVLFSVAIVLLATSVATAAPDFAVLKIQPYEPRKPAPEFVLQDLQGKMVRLSDYRGRLLLLFFYTTW